MNRDNNLSDQFRELISTYFDRGFSGKAQSQLTPADITNGWDVWLQLGLDDDPLEAEEVLHLWRSYLTVCTDQPMPIHQWLSQKWWAN